MDRFDRQIVAFVRSWAPYGGPPADEVLTEFGMTREQLADRFHLILATEAARQERERLPQLRARNEARAARRRNGIRVEGR
jgi:hypothetical protein